jgi:dihydrofolate synthase/folylpolyglutamate synthase
VIDEHNKAKTYDDALDFLYNLQKFGIKLGLENMHSLSRIMGRPEQCFSSIHVAGTNGKGSTCSMIASILEEEGFRVGLFLSPHFKSFTERISINRSEISKETCLELTNYIRELVHTEAPQLKPTFFEFITSMAFYYFAQNKVDFSVIETGMGGRLDATNILSPLVSVLTPVGLDHMQYLGKNISDIAFEKAGIIKPHVPVVTSIQETKALDTVLRIASEKNSEVHIRGRDFSYIDKSQQGQYPAFCYRGYNTYDNLSVPLYGKHQIINAAAAIRVYEVLHKKGHMKQPLCEPSIRKGLAQVKVQGRFEVVSHNPTVIIDGAHNPEAARALSHTLKEMYPHQKIVLVVGIMSDKDAQGILEPLSSLSRCIILTQAQGQRASTPDELASSLPLLEREKTVITRSVSQGLEKAFSQCTTRDIIVITGSFYIAGEAMEVFSGQGVFSTLRE